MIIQIVLSIGLGLCLFYVVSLGRSSPLIRAGLFAMVVAGLIFVWFPDVTNRIAKLVGVGRGADLVMYVWIVVNLLLVLRLHLKLRDQSETLTKIARHIALNEAGDGDQQ
jgi:hypothetical protein